MEEALVALGVGIIFLFYEYYKLKFLSRPELTIEITSKRSSNARGSINKTVLNLEGNVDGNNAIRHKFELIWRIKVIITNNSDLTAFYPELEFNPAGSKFRIDQINRLKPVKPSESLELLGEFNKHEVVELENRTDIGKALLTKFGEFELLLGYENSKKRRVYTLFNFNESEKKNKFLDRKPKDWKRKDL